MERCGKEQRKEKVLALFEIPVDGSRIPTTSIPLRASHCVKLAKMMMLRTLILLYIEI
jgi:hypothetical protein